MPLGAVSCASIIMGENEGDEMYQYSLTQWLFFFYFYCFFGWCFESSFVSVKERRLVNRGFMRGPFLPLYGSGAIMMLLVSRPFQGNIVLIYFAGCVGATALEYVTGAVMEALFKVRYWDYSNQKFQLHGYICLSSTIAWGFLTILMTEVVHKPVERFALSLPENLLNVFVTVLTVALSADFALSFKAAMDLRDVLLKMESAKENLQRIQKRLDVVIAVIGEDINNRVGELEERKNLGFEELKESLEERFDGLHTAAQKSSAYTERIREEVRELLNQYHGYVTERSRLSGLRDFFQRDMILSNPTMSSRRFGEALEELKKVVQERRKGE